jgi:predicted NodU family carbamoyl transferase
LVEHGIRAPVFFFNHHLTHAASAYLTSPHDEVLIVTSDGGGDAISGGIYVGRGGRIENKATFSKLNSAGNLLGDHHPALRLQSGAPRRQDHRSWRRTPTARRRTGC